MGGMLTSTQDGVRAREQQARREQDCLQHVMLYLLISKVQRLMVFWFYVLGSIVVWFCVFRRCCGTSPPPHRSWWSLNHIQLCAKLKTRGSWGASWSIKEMREETMAEVLFVSPQPLIKDNSASSGNCVEKRNWEIRQTEKKL